VDHTQVAIGGRVRDQAKKKSFQSKGWGKKRLKENVVRQKCRKNPEQPNKGGIKRIFPTRPQGLVQRWTCPKRETACARREGEETTRRGRWGKFCSGEETTGAEEVCHARGEHLWFGKTRKGGKGKNPSCECLNHETRKRGEKDGTDQASNAGGRSDFCGNKKEARRAERGAFCACKRKGGVKLRRLRTNRQSWGLSIASRKPVPKY